MSTLYGGPTQPPHRLHLFGGPNPPPRSAHAIVEALASKEALGTMLRAAYAAERPTDCDASRASADPGDKEIEDLMIAMDGITGAQRVLIAASAMSRGIRLDATSTQAEVVCAGSQVQKLVKPSGEPLVAAVAAVKDELPLGLKYLPQIAAEADFPFWRFFAALRVDLYEIPSHKYEGTCEVMEVVNAVVNSVIYPMKLSLNLARPNIIDKEIKPWISVPPHSSFPSGHATLGWATAHVLSACTGAKLDGLLSVAKGLARNRELAGLHTALDSKAGEQLGTQIGTWLAQGMDKAQTAGDAPWRALCWRAASEWVRAGKI